MNHTIAQAELLILEGELEQAGELLEEILQEEPDNLEAILFQGIVYAETRREDRAIKALEYYLSREEGSAEAWEALGCAWFRKGDNERGRLFLEKALGYDGESPSVLRNLGIIEEVLGNYEQSFRYLEKSNKADPLDYRTLYALGYSHLNRQEKERAAEYFSSLLTLSIPDEMRKEVLLLTLKMQLGWL